MTDELDAVTRAVKAEAELNRMILRYEEMAAQLERWAKLQRDDDVGRALRTEYSNLAYRIRDPLRRFPRGAVIVPPGTFKLGQVVTLRPGQVLVDGQVVQMVRATDEQIAALPPPPRQRGWRSRKLGIFRRNS